MNLYKFSIGLAFPLAVLAGRAQAQSLNLSAAFERALAADPGIHAAAQQRLAGREKMIQGKTLFQPRVTLSASVTAINNHVEATVSPDMAELVQPNTAGNVRQVEVQVAMPLINAGAAASRAQMSRQTEAAEMAWTSARQDLMLRVAETYFGVLAARESQHVAESENAALGQQHERALARFVVGLDKLTDLHETLARRDGAQARQVSSQSLLAQQVAQFESLTGAPASSLAALAPVASLVAPVPDQLQDWQTRAGLHNARLQLKRIDVAMAQEDTRRYGMYSRPTLDLVGRYTAQDMHGDLSPLVAAERQRTGNIGLRLDVPLFNAGYLDSREREALAKARQADLEFAALQRDVLLQVQEAFLDVHTGISRLSALQASEQSARQALAATTQSRDVGMLTQLDVLNAQQQLFRSQHELMQARVALLLSRARLAWATGELDEDVLHGLDGELI
jgi:outer membrane protein